MKLFLRIKCADHKKVMVLVVWAEEVPTRPIARPGSQERYRASALPMAARLEAEEAVAVQVPRVWATVEWRLEPTEASELKEVPRLFVPTKHPEDPSASDPDLEPP